MFQMARKPRIEFPGAFYHVLTRGNKKEDIFLEEAGRKRFLDRLYEYKHRYDFIVYAYVLMANHIHILIQTKAVPLSKIMQALLQSHTQWHNKKYKLVGHLFQGRYKAILCEKNAYLQVLICYIHLNPVRAGLVDNPMNYLWSSHRAYLGIEENRIVNTEFVLGQLSKNKLQAARLYADLVHDYSSMGRKDEYYKVRDQRILGSEEFYDCVMRKTRENVENPDRILPDKEVEDIIRAVGKLTGVALLELQGTTRKHKVVRARALFIRLAGLYTNMKKKDISAFLNRDPGSMKYIERRITEEDLWGCIGELKW